MVAWYRSYLIPFGLALIAFLIITTGGWIRISDAGESCPDWPKCFGTWGFDISEEQQAEWWEENPDEIDSRGAQHRSSSVLQDITQENWMCSTLSPYIYSLLRPNAIEVRI